LPADFVQRLRDRRERNGVKNDDTLIFPNSNGGVDSCLLARVRNAATRAGYTEHFGLHKFRKTFGTRYADKHGVRTAQKLLGHSNIKTTEKYLAVGTISNGQADSSSPMWWGIIPKPGLQILRDPFNQISEAARFLSRVSRWPEVAC